MQLSIRGTLECVPAAGTHNFRCDSKGGLLSFLVSTSGVLSLLFFFCLILFVVAVLDRDSRMRHVALLTTLF